MMWPEVRLAVTARLHRVSPAPCILSCMDGAGRHAASAVASPAPSPGLSRPIIVPAAPRAPIRAMAGKVMARRAARRLPFSITVPSSGSAGNPRSGGPVLRLRRPDEFYRRLGTGGLIGFGEAFQAGDCDCDDLPGLL